MTVDSVVFQIRDNQLEVLLIQRAQDPFKDLWALPGGYNAAGQTTLDALGSVLNKKAGVDIKNLKLVEQLYTFDNVARDPRGHAVSVTYMGLGINIEPRLSAGTEKPTFHAVSSLPGLAFDHKQIIDYAVERLRSKLGYTNAVFALLPELFSLSELQSAYEAILDRPLDKRNFRKKFLSLELIEATDEMQQQGAHRPARLYRFREQQLQSLTRSFD